jgi:hypothetical protein
MPRILVLADCGSDRNRQVVMEERVVRSTYTATTPPPSWSSESAGRSWTPTTSSAPRVPTRSKPEVARR